MVAMLGETTGPYFLSLLRDRMLQDSSGRRILRHQPVVNSLTMDLDKLRKLPEETFGKAYVNFLDREHVSPDTRVPVSLSFLHLKCKLDIDNFYPTGKIPPRPRA